MTTAAELTFGIEIETTVAETEAATNGLQIGSYYGGCQVPYLPDGWMAKRDGSIHPTATGRIGCEIVSPILRGADGLAQVVEVARILEEKGHKVNASCGVHVHVGWSRWAPSAALARLISLVSSVEKGLYAVTGTKAREQGQWCGGVRKYGDDKKAKENMDQDRYHVLNLTNLARGTRDTVEFRAFSGSLNSVKLVGWVQICLGLVEKALNGKKKAPWNPKRNCKTADPKKAGQLETFRLMMSLGWVEAKKYSYGWISEQPLTLPTQETVMAEMRRLAKKYDETA
jgi:hypothetical protein